MPELTTHTHSPPVTVGGVTLARVIEIINGYTITFEDGSYAVNLNGANSNVGDVVNLNQVSIRSNNSAGLTYSKEIEDQSFVDARVFIDTIDGQPGSQYPRGTATSPVDNVADAFLINSSRSLPGRYILAGSITLSSEDITRTDWIGTSLPEDSIALGGSTTTTTHFERLKLSGAATGVFTARDCVMENISGFNGFLWGGALAGTLTLAAGEAHIVNAHSAAPAGMDVTIDVNGVDVDVFLPSWEGDLTINNHSHSGASVMLICNGGTVTLDATCTDGLIVIKGAGTLIDNSGVGCTVVNQLVDPIEVAVTDASTGGNVTVSPDGLTVTIYAKDGVTVLRTLDVTANQKTRTIQ